jgi:MYXO-CTERM domain-containing protein
MLGSKVLTCLRASVLAGSLLLWPIATPLSAQTTTPTPDTPRVETRADTPVERDYTGLWGLLGLLGLAGLAGRRRVVAEEVYTNREPLRPEMHTRR